MEPTINLKVEKRLLWLTRNLDERKVLWLINYVEKNTLNWDVNNFDIPPPIRNPGIEPTSDFCEKYIQYVLHSKESPRTRENCRNLKAAWIAWDKRDKNRISPSFIEGNYKISVQARAQLENLATIETENGLSRRGSFSSVIENLLLNSKEIEHLQKELRKYLTKTNYGFRVEANFLSTFFCNEKTQVQAEMINQGYIQELSLLKNEHTKNIASLNKKIKELEKNNKILFDEITLLKENNNDQ